MPNKHDFPCGIPDVNNFVNDIFTSPVTTTQYYTAPGNGFIYMETTEATHRGLLSGDGRIYMVGNKEGATISVLKPVKKGSVTSYHAWASGDPSIQITASAKFFYDIGTPTIIKY